MWIVFGYWIDMTTNPNRPGYVGDETTQILRKETLKEIKRLSEKIPSLIVIQGNDTGQIFKLTASAMSLGRGTGTPLRINDKAISRKHCLFEVSPPIVTLIDLQSANGTFVNGKRIAKKKLVDGDKIQIGSSVLKFEMSDLDDSEFHEKLYQMITFDDLTSLYNSKYMKKQLNLLFRAHRGQFPFTILFLDLDYFKLVNDNYDHITGSGVLSELGRLLLSNLRSSDIPCRYGGEEFVIILQDTTALQAVFVAEKMRKIIENHVFYTREAAPIHITVSIGIAEVSKSYKTVTDLIARSDEAMYKAKESGRNRTVLFREDSDPPFVVVTPTGLDENTPSTITPVDK